MKKLLVIFISIFVSIVSCGQNLSSVDSILNKEIEKYRDYKLEKYLQKHSNNKPLKYYLDKYKSVETFEIKIIDNSGINKILVNNKKTDLYFSSLNDFNKQIEPILNTHNLKIEIKDRISWQDYTNKIITYIYIFTKK